MAITSWYRGIRFVKDFMVKYLNYIFIAGERDAIVFTDGSKKIEFSSKPQAMKRASWDYRVLPVVLVGQATGGLEYVTFSNDLLGVSTPNDTDNKYCYGGNIDLTLSLDIRATTIEERDNLVDITAIYLAHPGAKEYFMRHDIKLPDAPKLGQEQDIKEPNLDFPIYSTSLTIRTITRWQDIVEFNYRLEELLVDISAEMDTAEELREKAGAEEII